MGEFIKKYPILYALINFALTILVISFLLKMYVDYRVEEKIEGIQQQLNTIESSTNTILEILKNNEHE